MLCLEAVLYRLEIGRRVLSWFLPSLVTLVKLVLSLARFSWTQIFSLGYWRYRAMSLFPSSLPPPSPPFSPGGGRVG